MTCHRSTAEPTLFTNRQRDEHRRKRHAEGHFEFLDRGAGSYWDALRASLEAWFSAYPSTHKAQLRSRFRSSDERSTMGAFWELYLHEALRRSGLEVELEPELPNARGRPDFLVRHPDEPFVLEATVVSHSDEDAAAKRRRAWLYDVVNEVVDPRFWIDVVSVDAESAKGSPKRRLQSDLRAWMAAVRDAEVTWERVRTNLAPTIRWRDEKSGWAVTFTLLPRAGPPDGPTDAIGIYPVETFIGDLSDEFRKHLQRKANRYGTLTHPFIVAVLLLGERAEAEAVEPVLYGRTASFVHLRPGRGAAGGLSYPYRMRDGFWVGPRGTANTRVSAILTAVNLQPWLAGMTRPTLWLNPQPARPLPRAHIPWDTRMLGTIVHSSGADPAVLFGLPPHWPAPGDPFEHEPDPAPTESG